MSPSSRTEVLRVSTEHRVSARVSAPAGLPHVDRTRGAGKKLFVYISIRGSKVTLSILLHGALRITLYSFSAAVRLYSQE